MAILGGTSDQDCTRSFARLRTSHRGRSIWWTGMSVIWLIDGASISSTIEPCLKSQIVLTTCLVLRSAFFLPSLSFSYSSVPSESLPQVLRTVTLSFNNAVLHILTTQPTGCSRRPAISAHCCACRQCSGSIVLCLLAFCWARHRDSGTLRLPVSRPRSVSVFW